MFGVLRIIILSLCIESYTEHRSETHFMNVWVVEKYKGTELMVTTTLKKACKEFGLSYRSVLRASKIKGEDCDQFEIFGADGAWSFRKTVLVKRN
jgi:hypothetical protein